MLQFFIFLTAVVVFCVGDPIKPNQDIVSPCDLRDLKCIRDNLEANSVCDRNVLGSIPNAYSLTNFTFETPFFNATYIDNLVTITNQDKCYVSKFFFNMKRDSAVLAVDCPYLGIASNRTLIQHRSLDEDVSYSYLINGVYPLVRLTANLKQADKIDLCSAFVFGDVTALPIFKINPNNQKTANFLSRDLSFLQIYERETFFYRAPQLFNKYINSIICNFGC